MSSLPQGCFIHEHQGSSRNIKDHQGSSRNIKEHQGSSMNFQTPFFYCLLLLMPGKRQRKVFIRTLANRIIPLCRPKFFFVGARLAHPSQGQVTGTPSKKWSSNFQPDNSNSIQGLVCFHPFSVGTRVLWGLPFDLHHNMCDTFSDSLLACMRVAGIKNPRP